jgi:hypothetical protein
MEKRGQKAQRREDHPARKELRTTSRPKADVREEPESGSLPRAEARPDLDEALEGLRQCRDTIPDDLWKLALDEPEDSLPTVTIPAPPPVVDDE